MHKQLCAAEISWIWGCLNFVNLYYVQLYVNFVLYSWSCYQSVINLKHCIMYICTLICIAQLKLLSICYKRRESFWKYIAMLPNLSSEYISQFTLVIATVVTYAACINPLPFLFENFSFINHLVLSPCRSSLTLSPPFKRKRKRLN